MCEFCVRHGDGEKWYLQASTYACDLEHDLERRGYIVDFVRDFDRNRARAVAGLELVQGLPGPIRRFVRRRVRAGFLENHFGQPIPIEDCERVFGHTTSITRIPCVCRRFAGTRDDAYCMVVTTKPIDDVLMEGFSDYEDGPDLSDFQRVDPSEALEMLADCEERGLMHSVWTFKTPFAAAICNCDLPSGCMAMRITRTYDVPIMWRGEYVARVDDGACTGCGACVALCPFGAIEVESGANRARPRPEACYGCGICRTACGEAAMSLVERARVPEAAAVW